MKQTAALTRSQIAFLELATQNRDEMIALAERVYQQRIAVVGQDCGVPAGTPSRVSPNPDPASSGFSLEWDVADTPDVPDIAPAA